MDNTLSMSELYILLSLAMKSRHGYEIMKQVESDSNGKIQMGPGTLYGTIKRMLASDLIENVPGDDARRKYYRVTEKGASLLTNELERYDETVKLAKRANILNGMNWSAGWVAEL
jgi:DNA-binding PadR family transcriptional regulator